MNEPVETLPGQFLGVSLGRWKEIVPEPEQDEEESRGPRPSPGATSPSGTCLVLPVGTLGKDFMSLSLKKNKII